jgi:hypothetical protein
MALQTVDFSDIQNRHVNYNNFFNQWFTVI